MLTLAYTHRERLPFLPLPLFHFVPFGCAMPENIFLSLTLTLSLTL